jgi:hypothetical protein
MTIHLFLLQPEVVFTARVNMASATYPLNEIIWDGLVEGAYADIRHGMTLTLGSTQYADDLGRQRIRGDSTATLLRVGRSSKGTRDGELTANDDSYISVYDDHRVWAKIPYIDADGVIFKDAEIDYSDQTLEPPPVAIAGPGIAATIDGSDVITVAFDGSDSYATADGATITDYGWDLKDGTVTAGSVSTATVTATFPAGFRWINLTVTDSNGKQMTTHRPIYARDPAEDGQPGGCVTYFQIESHRITPAGQQIALRIRQEIDAGDYPDGTLAMLWDGEPASASDRSHMLFTGWHQVDPATIQAERTGTLRDVVLNCLDVAGRLDTLPGFPQTIERDATPDSWYQMANLNFDRFMHYLLHWDSTALEVADWYWSGTGDDYEYVRLEAAGDSLYDQIERQALRICPDHHFTCNTMGRLFVNPDPLLQDTGDRTATIQATLTAADYSDIRYPHQRPPRIRQLWGEALLASPTTITPLFCVAPGNSPGQGEQESRHSEQLATSQSSLNAVTGHRYARLNAPQGVFSITLAQGNDLDIEPADMTWVELTIPASVAAQRGLAFTESRGLVKELSIRYSHERTGLVRTVDLQWERETSGSAAATVTPAATEPVDDGNDWTPTPPAVSTEPGFYEGMEIVGCISNLGSIYKTANFQSNPPTWVRFSGMETTPFGTGNEIISFVVDPFSPLYRGTGSTVRGFAATEDGIYRIDNLFGTTPTATLLHTFPEHVSVTSFGRWRSIAASFGRFFEDEADNPWIMVASTYVDAVSDMAGVWVIYSQDAGATWSSEIQVTIFENTDLANHPQRVAGLYLSPKTPGYALVGVYMENADPADTAIYESTDWGATWAPSTLGLITTNGLGGCIHVPWPDNDDESLAFCGELIIAPSTHILTYGTRRNGTDITPTEAGKTYGPWWGNFGIRTYDGDAKYVAMAGFGNGVDDEEDSTNGRAAAFVSDDYGNNWTLIAGPDTTEINDLYPSQIAFAADNPQVLFIWGNQGYIQYSEDFGATLQDKSNFSGGTVWSNEGMVGFYGGEA